MAVADQCRSHLERILLLVTGHFVYIAAFAIGLGPIPFLIIGELSYPQDAATAQSWYFV